MNPGSWNIAVNVLSIIIFLFCTLTIAVTAAVFVWALRHIDKTLAPAMQALVAIEKPFAKMVESLENVSTVAGELKELKEGDLRIIQALVKAANEFRATVEEFHAALFAGPPQAKRRKVGVGGVDEVAEQVAERRKAEGGESPANLNEFLDARGKHAGVV